MTLSTPITIVLTDIQLQMGALVAKYRWESHNGNRLAKSDLGKYGLAADKYGCQVEIALPQALNTEGVPTPGVILFAEPAPKGGGDLVIGPYRYSAKSSPPNRWRVCYNMEQYHKKSFKTDFVICAFYETETRLVLTKPIPHAEVAGWEKDETGRDPFYFKARKEFELLTDWSELPGVSSVLKPESLSN
jgi:hypothetical protein